MKPTKPITRKAATTLTMVGPAAINDETHEEKGSSNLHNGRADDGKQSELKRPKLRE